MPLPPLPKKFRLKWQGIGADPKTGSDMDFYDWLAGDDKSSALSELARFAIDTIKEEQDPHVLYQMLLDFKANVPAEEYTSWTQAFSSVTPPTHPLHAALKKVELEHD